MPSGCVVPNCTTNKYKCTEKWSTFLVPKDENLRIKWAASIPEIKCLRLNQRVCEKHFKKHFIIKEFIKYDNNGKLIAQVPLKCARLQSGAVPTIFEQSSSLRSRSPLQKKDIKNYTDHSYALQKPSNSSHSRATIEEMVCTTATFNYNANVVTQSLDELENKIFEHSSKTNFQNESVEQKEKEFVEDAKLVSKSNLSANVSVEADTNVNSHC